MHARTRIDDYRGRKDSALALHYLWRIGDVMVTRRERFERVYALTEAVAPAEALREVDAEEADEVLLRKQIAADGLTRLSRPQRPAPAAGPARPSWPSAVRAGWPPATRSRSGWRAGARPSSRSAPIRRGSRRSSAGEIPTDWAPMATTTDEEAVFLSPLDPVSARGRAKPLFGFDYVWEVYKPAELRSFGYYTMPILWGDRLVGRFDPKLDRSSGTLVINGLWLEDRALARDAAFGEALERGMARFVRFLGAERVDASAVTPSALRRRLTGSRDRPRRRVANGRLSAAQQREA